MTQTLIGYLLPQAERRTISHVHRRALQGTRAVLLALIAVVQTAVTNAAEAELFLGHTTNVVDRGAGPAIVLIHGLGADLSTWHHNIDNLAQTHRVLAVDLMGFGESAKPTMDYRIQLYVDQVRALLTSRGIEKAVIVGNSMGGLVALRYAEVYPKGVKALVLVAPAFVFGLPSGVSSEQLASGANPQTLDAMRQYQRRVMPNHVLTDSQLTHALILKKAKGDDKTIQSIAASLGAGEDVFTKHRIGKIHTRTLILHGTHDGVVPTAASQALASLMPDAQLVELPVVGHWPQIEKHAFFNELVVEWIE